MKNEKIVIIKCLLLAFLSFGTNLYADFGGTTLEFFKKNNKRGYLLNDDYLNSFYFGSNISQKTLKSNIGYDIPLATVTRSSGYVYSIGIPAKVHLYLYNGESGYAIDNLYWDIGFWVQIDINKAITFRLSPFCHRSAYITKRNDSISLNESISNNMIYLEMLLTPPKAKGFEIKGAAGYFYHTEARHFLRGVVDVDFFYEFPLKFPVVPALFLKNHVIYEKGVRYGVDGGVGIEAKSSSLRGLGIFLRLFDTPHPGSYYFESEKGVGGELRFIF